MSVVVVGSINQDVIVRVPRHPVPGETVLGTSHLTAAGGKGANQAVAVARLGRPVAMVGRVGDDHFGHALRHGLEGEGIDVGAVRVDTGTRTGLAVITLDPAGENAIVVSPGANGRVGAGDVAAAGHLLGAADVTLLQLEIPLEAVVAAAELSAGTVVLNPAPAAPLSGELLALADVLVPNRHELAALAGVPLPDSPAAVEEAARRLTGPGAVVVTLGEQGALLVAGSMSRLFAAPSVRAVDTVGAGDAFCGALGDGLAGGLGLEAAVARAVHAGALATTRAGAQPAMPARTEVERSMSQ